MWSLVDREGLKMFLLDWHQRGFSPFFPFFCALPPQQHADSTGYVPERVFLPPPACLPASDSVPPSFSLLHLPLSLRLSPAKLQHTHTHTHKHTDTRATFPLNREINTKRRQEQDRTPPARTIHGPPLDVCLTGGYVDYLHLFFKISTLLVFIWMSRFGASFLFHT